MGFRWLALRARLSSAIKLTISVNLINSFRQFVCFRFIATVRGKGEPSNQIDYDFELVFRKTQETSYVVQNMLEKWVDGFTVCAWIYTPGVEPGKKMTVISVLTKMNGVHKVLRVQIDGQGNFEFSYENDRWGVFVNYRWIEINHLIVKVYMRYCYIWKWRRN